MNRAIQRSASSQQGFTLIELLVALALTGLIGVLLSAGLRAGARTWEVGRTLSTTMDRIGAVQALLRRQIAQTYPLRQEDGGLKETVVFDGRRDQASFVGAAPRQFAQRGLHTFRISTRRSAKGRDLILSWCAIPACEAGSERSSDFRDAVLVEGITSAAFEYGFRDRTGKLRWDRRWRERGVLPALLRLKVDFARGDKRLWPELVVALTVDRTGRCAFDPISRDCREG